VQSGCLEKHICYHSHSKADEKQGYPFDVEWQPEDEYKIEIRNDKLVQRRNFVQHKNLEEHDEYEPDDIFEE
jgi:hypothetical protein